MSSINRSRLTAGNCDLDDIQRRLLKVDGSHTKYASITEEEIFVVCQLAKDIFKLQPMLVEVFAPITVCGDTHGQFLDLLRIFELNGSIPDTAYLFLGDYVDRGDNSIENILYLFILKIKYPGHLFLLRGNHEAMRNNCHYGLLEECTKRFSKNVFKALNNVFGYMPIAGIVADRIFCCHGGISRELKDLDQIRNMKRPIEDECADSLVADILWADPSRKQDGWSTSRRGVSFYFGTTQLKEFLKRFKLDLLARAHEVANDGYEFSLDQQCVTVFSAPKYCKMDNSAGIMNVAADLTLTFKVIGPDKKEIFNSPNYMPVALDENELLSLHLSETCMDPKTPLDELPFLKDLVSDHNYLSKINKKARSKRGSKVRSSRQRASRLRSSRRKSSRSQ